MAKYGQKNTQKVYATDKEGMLADAKEYAKRDFPQLVKVMEEMKIDKKEEELATALIAVKLEQIKQARTNRVSYFD